MAKVVDSNLATIVPATNLTQQFGFGQFWVRCESDGNRFAVLHATQFVPNPPLAPATFSLRISTLAVVNNAFTVQESVSFLVPGIFGLLTNANPITPLLTSKRTGGGVRGDYAVTFIPRVFFPLRPWVATYRSPVAPITFPGGGGTTRGWGPVGGPVRRATGCGPAKIEVSGTSVPGGSLQLQVTGAGTTGILCGLPASIKLPSCTGCTLGVADPFVLPSSLTMPITFDPALVGATIAFQGYDLGSGTCLGGLALTDTIDVTLR
jgi:hypothetical protein